MRLAGPARARDAAQEERREAGKEWAGMEEWAEGGRAAWEGVLIFSFLFISFSFSKTIFYYFLNIAKSILKQTIQTSQPKT